MVDDHNRLLGRITIDDVVDLMEEEAEKDYQLASGLSDEVESDDSLWDMTRARLPWLLIGLFGGLAGAYVIGVFDIERFPSMALFIPLIAAMGGNVGVQSAAIVVQGLAAGRNPTDARLMPRLLKEFSVALLNGAICSAIILGASLALGLRMELERNREPGADCSDHLRGIVWHLRATDPRSASRLTLHWQQARSSPQPTTSLASSSTSASASW